MVTYPKNEITITIVTTPRKKERELRCNYDNNRNYPKKERKKENYVVTTTTIVTTPRKKEREFYVVTMITIVTIPRKKERELRRNYDNDRKYPKRNYERS